MKERNRIALRIAAIFGIVLFCAGASSCTRPVEDVMYAPGYGYIVKVQQQSFGGEEVELEYYYVFPTEQRAAEFYKEYYRNSDGFQGTLQQGEYYVLGGSPDYNRIKALMVPLPPPPALNETEIPLATPDLPEPIPQAPQ